VDAQQRVCFVLLCQFASRCQLPVTPCAVQCLQAASLYGVWWLAPGASSRSIAPSSTGEQASCAGGTRVLATVSCTVDRAIFRQSPPRPVHRREAPEQQLPRTQYSCWMLLARAKWEEQHVQQLQRETAMTGRSTSNSRQHCGPQVSSTGAVHCAHCICTPCTALPGAGANPRQSHDVGPALLPPSGREGCRPSHKPDWCPWTGVPRVPAADHQQQRAGLPCVRAGSIPAGLK
jgi:hypothetical protein